MPLFPGESVGLIENLKGNSSRLTFMRGVQPEQLERWKKSLDSSGAFIQAFEPKLYIVFQDLEKKSNVMFNVVKIIHDKYIQKARKQLNDNPFDTIVDKKIVSSIESEMQPLTEELKKLKSLSNGTFFKKSESQKVINALKEILIKRTQEIIDEFKSFKKNPVIN